MAKQKAVVPTTAQSLGSLLKSARDIMRKDKGLNGDLDRLPLLTWIMFLKFLDDLERQREDEAALGGKPFRAAIEQPYRWRDWAAQGDGITGDELLSFINAEECTRPDGSKGAGLFAYLRSLTAANGDDRRDVIATVFKGVDNRMKSGYLLRDVINKVHGIHFTSGEELHTLSSLYESMLREMRDAAGDSGEFYTPRPVIRFMVDVIDPQLGETVLDPACGTGGFLVEAFKHLNTQIKTVEDRRTLQAHSLFGCEAKPLPYLLAQMNLLLHGLDSPQIDPGNALRFKLTEIGEKERVAVILTNPPFGGAEEKGIQGNFPDDLRTTETSLLFIQLIVRKLHRRTGRGAIVVPDGFLSNPGVSARVRRLLLDEVDLYAIVRLPFGVFEPYTPIKTNIVLFKRGRSTEGVWFYEVPIADGRKKYTKTRPLTYEEFGPCLDWIKQPAESDRAWHVSRQHIESSGYNLDCRNPRAIEEKLPVSPRDLSALLVAEAEQLSETAKRIESIVALWEQAT